MKKGYSEAIAVECAGLLSCNLMHQIDCFLSNELEKETTQLFSRRKIQAEIIRCEKDDDVYYAFLSPNPQLALFEETTWVGVKRGSASILVLAD